MAEQKTHNDRGRTENLARELSLAEERERQRLSAALHDGVGQDLLVARIKMGLLKETLSSADHAESLAEVIELVDRAARSVSSLTFELCPPVLYEKGLQAALAWLVERFERRSDTAFEFVASGPPWPMSNEFRGLMFQIVRELLANVVRHACASSAMVLCETSDREMTITVGDDGVGFDPAAVGKLSDGTGGFGLFSIRRRLRHVAGRLDINSGPHRGSRITVVVPLAGERDGHTDSAG